MGQCFPQRSDHVDFSVSGESDSHHGVVACNRCQEVARVTRAFFSQGNGEAHLNDVTARAVAGAESGELRHFPRRARVAARVPQPAELDAPDRAA